MNPKMHRIVISITQAPFGPSAMVFFLLCSGGFSVYSPAG
jgi:hypothetical protein